MADNIARGIRKLYDQDEILITPLSFVGCMKKEIIGMIPGVDIYQLFKSGDLKAYIEGKLWGKAASFIGKQIVKFGVKTNIASLIAQLGISGAKCTIWG